MKERIARTYIADDGKEFKRKADACRHDAEVYVAQRGYEPEQFDKMFEQVHSRTRAGVLGISDWRDCYKVRTNGYSSLLDDIIDTYEGLKNASLIVFDFDSHKVIYDKNVDWLADDGRQLEQAAKEAEARFTDDDYECRNPTTDELHEFLRLVKTDRNLSNTTLLVRKIRPMTITQKLERGISLTEDELRDFVFGGKVKYQEEGQPRRWSRSVSSVVADDNGQLWCVDWDEGLTEMQEDEFYEQPYKVHLDKKPVTVIKTTIVRDE
jgi:hypothetical protein